MLLLVRRICEAGLVGNGGWEAAFAMRADLAIWILNAGVPAALSERSESKGPITQVMPNGDKHVQFTDLSQLRGVM
jgi:hypothetical protein